ncbi:SirB2 family protein [Pasteurellaceae bacterium HPA106]|uniref:SirB2 family protein n=1 Tax=Spirabiliibacterium pneumoniae TaxID=221400 RepID=UPI001AAD1500|nr:SirB2 family protein [Spirabiliibacterium pneumoniae]MBE2896651.1 SirB2 family protein [Spirabiliibacterium pneumoniae]
MAFESVLLGHVIFAFLALGFLLIRGVMQYRGLNWRSILVLRVMPHIVDTLLLLSGALMIYLGYPMFTWLWIKLALLLGYIIFAAKTFNRHTPKPHFFIPALLCLLAVMGIAYFH